MAAQAAGVKQFIFVSGLIMSALSAMPFFNAKLQAEDYLCASGIPYTILASDMFMESWVRRIIIDPILAGQPVILPGDGSSCHSFISERDVAAFAVAAVGHPAAINQRIPLGGPQVLSWRDAVNVCESLLDREIPVQYDEGNISAARIGIHVAEEVMRETASTFGVNMTTLGTFAKGLLNDGSL